MAKCALTTFDNPYNPFEQFDAWYMFDMDKGYCSCGYLDRIARTSSQLSDEENEKEIERAIDEIIKLDPFNLYKKVFLNETNSSGTNKETAVNDLPKEVGGSGN